MRQNLRTRFSLIKWGDFTRIPNWAQRLLRGGASKSAPLCRAVTQPSPTTVSSYMSSPFSARILLGSLPLLLSAVPAFGHLSYSNRNFGIFSGLVPQEVTIANQTVPNNWGWADGTDGDFAHSHELR